MIPSANGGTGVNNGTKIITIGGNLTTTPVNDITLTTTGGTNVTLPVTGTLATLNGTETFTNKTLTSPTLTTPVINGTISGTTVFPVVNGGTSQSSYTDGQILIGNTATGGLTKTTITQASSKQVIVTNGNGSITLSTPQNIDAGAAPTFSGLTVTGLGNNLGVYTNGSGGLTTAPPSTGVLGYWNRSGSVLSPSNSGDAISTTGNISTTGSGTITSAGLLTGQKGLTVTGDVVNLNNDGTTNGVNIGGTGVQTINVGTGLTGASTVAVGSVSSTTNINSGSGAININASNNGQDQH